MAQTHYPIYSSCKKAGYRLHKKTGKTVYIIESFWGWTAVTVTEKFDKVVYIIGA